MRDADNYDCGSDRCSCGREAALGSYYCDGCRKGEPVKDDAEDMKRHLIAARQGDLDAAKLARKHGFFDIAAKHDHSARRIAGLLERLTGRKEVA